MKNFFEEIKQKLCNNQYKSWLEKLEWEYALFRIVENQKFLLIRAKGIFLNKTFIENLQNDYIVWMDVFEKQIYEFLYQGNQFIVILDSLKNPNYCIYIKINESLLDFPKEIFYLIFCQEMEKFLIIEANLPRWYREILWEHIPKKSPLFIISEIGSLEKNFIDSFLAIKLGSLDDWFFFESFNLTEKIQQFELFGDDPGERFKQENTIPIFNLDLKALVFYEVTNLSLKIQRRVGEYIKKNQDFFNKVFCIFTSNYDIEKMLEHNQFDPFLWELIHQNKIVLPPLRKVGELLMEEANRYLDYLSKKFRKKVEFTKEAVEKVLQYDWPGNLEEFYQTLETAFILSKDGKIEANDLLFGLWKDYEKKDLNLRKNIENLEKSFILQAYRLLGGNQVHMAQVLGISRGSLQYKIQKYGIRIYE